MSETTRLRIVSDGTPKGTKVIDVASMDSPPKGTVTYCTGKDISGGYHAAAEGFEKKFGAQGYKLKIVEFPEAADEQRNQFVQRQQAKSPECDIFGADVISSLCPVVHAPL